MSCLASRHIVALLSVILMSMPASAGNRKHSVSRSPNTRNGTTYVRLIQDIGRETHSDRAPAYVPPTAAELREWNAALIFFQAHDRSGCQSALESLGYSLLEVTDPASGAVFDVFKEKSSTRKGWGTFIYNRSRAKRLIVEINHPVEDDYTLGFGSELFRQLRGEWMFVSGSGKNSGGKRLSSDMGRVRRSVFQQWHEMLSDLTHVTLSLHAFTPPAASDAWGGAEIVVSNGKTSDEQWGISQLSLALRDTLGAAGFRTALAMYDSGYSSLAGGWNIQGVFSNDSVGFGHWICVELARSVRERGSEYPRLLAAFDHALELTGKKISQQVNRAFGLVSPRVVRLDSLHGMLFSPAEANRYRIISLAENGARNDTVDIRLGNWLNLSGGVNGKSSVSALDSAGQFAGAFRGNDSRGEVSRIVSLPEQAQAVRFVSGIGPELSGSDETDQAAGEPLQVHRIHLNEVFSPAEAGAGSGRTAFDWMGIAPHRVSVEGGMAEVHSTTGRAEDDGTEAPKFLVPIINRSYESQRSGFIGVQMTTVLMTEIARVVNEYPEKRHDVGLLAERAETGDYYLRIFPAVGYVPARRP